MCQSQRGFCVYFHEQSSSLEILHYLEKSFHEIVHDLQSGVVFVSRKLSKPNLYFSTKLSHVFWLNYNIFVDIDFCDANRKDDKLLLELVKKHGTLWVNVAKQFNTFKTAKDCQTRHATLTSKLRRFSLEEVRCLP